MIARTLGAHLQVEKVLGSLLTQMNIEKADVAKSVVIFDDDSAVSIRLELLTADEVAELKKEREATDGATD